jgi:DNA-binding beta-propeller fold protein YncE
MIKLSILVAAFAALVSVHAAPAATPGPSGYAVTDSLKLGGDGFWDALTVDPSGHRLYLSHSTEVDVVDLDHKTLAGKIENTSGVHGIAIAPAVGEGYTSNGRDSTVTVFDLKSLKEVATIHVDARNPDAILFDPSSERVFTFNGGSSNATAIDIHTHKIVGTVNLGGKPEFAVSDSNGHVDVNLEDKNSVAQFDPKSLQVLHVWPLAPGEGPSGLAIDSIHHRLFCACGNQHMIVLNSDTGEKVADLPIGAGVDGAAFDPETQLAFSPNGGDGTLTVIHEETPMKFTVLESVPTRRGARTIGWDPGTHRIYLPTASLGPPPPPTADRPHPRPSILPGSFVVLVVSR